MVIDRIALILAIIGGINWGLVGLFRFDLVAYLFGGQTATVSRVVFALVGLAAIWCISLATAASTKKKITKPSQTMKRAVSKTVWRVFCFHCLFPP